MYDEGRSGPRMRAVRDVYVMLAGLIAGILAYNAGCAQMVLWIIIPSVIMLGYIYRHNRVTPVGAWRFRSVPAIITFLCCASAGLFTSWLNAYDDPRSLLNDRVVGVEGVVTSKSSRTSGDVLTVRINDLLAVKQGQDKNDIIKVPVRNVSVLVRTTSTDAYTDDAIIVTGKLNILGADRNIPDTSYVDNYRRRGIFYVMKADQQDIHITEHWTSFSGLGKRLRDYLTGQIERSGLKTNTAHFLITILLGNRDYLHSELRQAFAVAGVSHTLALSGMHISIIAGLLLVAFFPLVFFGRYKLQLLLATIFLWVYVYISGMAPSTVRGAIMFSFMAGGVILERRTDALRGLGLALILILAVSPYSVYDMGLQMSALCVAMLILFAGNFNPVSRRNHPHLYKFAALISASVCVSLSLWVVSCYYFKTVTPVFLWANLIMLPLLPFYLYLAIIYLIAAGCGLKITFIADILDFGFEKLETVINFIGQGSAIHYEVNGISVLLWVAGAVLIGIYMEYHRRKKMVFAGITLLLAAIVMMIISPVSDPLLIIHDYRDGVKFSCKIEDTVTDHTLKAGTVSYAEIKGLRIVSVDSPIEEFDSPGAQLPRHCEIMIIAGGYKGEIADLSTRCNPERIVFHKSLAREHEKELVEETHSLGLRMHSLRNDGPLRLKLKRTGLEEE